MKLYIFMITSAVIQMIWSPLILLLLNMKINGRVGEGVIHQKPLFFIDKEYL